ncbi:MAG: hypothetical protein R3324_16215 [Halobacteriales archaeon]|nr:hypothetical protein [Halobacteriales archaeon]
MSRSAEELLILNDGGRGLLAQAYNLSSRVYGGPPSLTGEMDKVCRLLVKRFPDHPSELSRTPGNEQFANAAKNIAAETKSLYTFYINLMAWSEKAWLLLKDISQNVVSMRSEGSERVPPIVTTSWSPPRPRRPRSHGW